MKSGLRFPRGLYGVTPEWDDTERLADGIRAAASGGMVALQWRRKTAAPEDRLSQARTLAQYCKELGVFFIVNDDWRVAVEIDADGVHLGREDGLLSEAREALGPDKIVGCSCYNDPALASLALMQDVDYVAFGAMYPSKVKPDAAQATLDDIRQGRTLTEQAVAAGTGLRTAVVAIGGITPENAAAVVRAGADSIALISGLFESKNIEAAAARCRDLFA